ncbi:hypothetical protein DFJ73DRAFT_806564 [Zopfochytrium polystomum]|nr:hypothetical protein DFJ73DRAFT_806564 [Zopfochytrium polystomum]
MPPEASSWVVPEMVETSHRVSDQEIEDAQILFGEAYCRANQGILLAKRRREEVGDDSARPSKLFRMDRGERKSAESGAAEHPPASDTLDAIANRLNLVVATKVQGRMRITMIQKQSKNVGTDGEAMTAPGNELRIAIVENLCLSKSATAEQSQQPLSPPSTPRIRVSVSGEGEFAGAKVRLREAENEKGWSELSLGEIVQKILG